MAWLLAREGIALPHDGPIDAIDAVDAAIVGEEVLADLFARELGSVVIDLDRGMLERDALQLLPESVARSVHAVPVLLEPARGVLQVAFANPLDRRAIEAVAEASGRVVQPLVAPLSAVRRTLDAEYGGSPLPETVAARKRSEMPAESTQRLTAKEEITSSMTAPLIRLEAQATVEQRFEALVLALVERGVITRSDYLEALKRLLNA